MHGNTLISEFYLGTQQSKGIVRAYISKLSLILKQRLPLNENLVIH